MRRILLAAALAAAATTGVARADTASDTRADLRCLIVAAMAASSTNPQTRQGGLVSFLYFQGRIEGRSPNLDLGQAIVAEVQRFPRAEFPREGQRCGGILSARGAYLRQLGPRLQQALGGGARR
jgi:hypothetical protein